MNEYSDTNKNTLSPSVWDTREGVILRSLECGVIKKGQMGERQMACEGKGSEGPPGVSEGDPSAAFRTLTFPPRRRAHIPLESLAACKLTASHPDPHTLSSPQPSQLPLLIHRHLTHQLPDTHPSREHGACC